MPMLSSISRLQFHIYGVEVLVWLVACNKINIYIVTPASVALGIIFAYDGFGRPSREQK